MFADEDLLHHVAGRQGAAGPFQHFFNLIAVPKPAAAQGHDFSGITGFCKLQTDSAQVLKGLIKGQHVRVVAQDHQRALYCIQDSQIAFAEAMRFAVSVHAHRYPVTKNFFFPQTVFFDVVMQFAYALYRLMPARGNHQCRFAELNYRQSRVA